MFRYLALTWNAMDRSAASTARLIARQLRAAPDVWCRSLDIQGLMVLHAGARPGSSETYVLQNDAGVVLGKLFEREIDDGTVPRHAVLNACETSAIVRSAGRILLENYWGRYVAFVRDAATRTTWVLRDPTGALPCFMTSFGNVSVFFSHAEDCLSIEHLRFSINWRYVAAYVCHPDLQTPDTGLDEVTAIQAGECLEISRDASMRRTLYWNPIYFAGLDGIESLDEAVELLRRTTRMCVWAWASCYPRIVHLLSGGLDSSIILNCLRAAPSRPQTTCLNYFGPSSPEEDEREFARLAASSAGCELIETEARGSTVRLDVILQGSRSAKPIAYQYYARHSRFEGQLAREKKAAAIFQGSGGDQVFYQNPISLAVADYVSRQGIRRDLFRIAMNVAQMERVSIWSVLCAAIRDGSMRRRWSPLAEVGKYLKLVTPAVIEATKRNDNLASLAMQASSGVPPGKLQHILMMSVATDLYDPLGLPDYPERVYPLLSQPLKELCLRIPTYILTAGGWDRAAARRAFQNELPPRIVSRRAKGGTDQEYRQMLQANLGFVRELLLDGLLVREKLLDRRKLERALTSQRVSVGSEAGEIIGEHLNTEAWLRSWAAGGRKAVA